jgi:hypothetical protein
MNTIAKEAHISGTSRNHDHRGRSCATRAGSCDMVDVSNTSLPILIVTPCAFGVISVGPDRGSVESAKGDRPQGWIGLTAVEDEPRGPWCFSSPPGILVS